jgi:hypothetical protein
MADLGARALTCNSLLHERRLAVIDHSPYQPDLVCVSLRVSGYDLGRRYGRWFDCTGLWFQQYKNHWIWLIVSLLGGIVGTFLLNLLSVSR